MEKFKNLVKCIIKSGAKYFLVEKWYDDRIVEPYQWEFIDGKIEFAETPVQAAKRLVYEGAGVVPDTITPIYTWGFTVGEICNIGIAFICEVSGEDVSLGDAYCEFQWVEADKISQYITNQSILMDLDQAGIIKYDSSNVDYEQWR